MTRDEPLKGLRQQIVKLQEPPNPDKCFRCGYVGAHDPYCLENPANDEWRDRLNAGLGEWLESLNCENPNPE